MGAFDVYTKSFKATDGGMYGDTMMNDDMDIDDGEEIGYLEIDEEANTDFDDEWDDASVIWDEISEFTTSEGDRIGQKCMHMWGQRLCLCQFLGWMDSNKYQCQQTRYMTSDTSDASHAFAKKETTKKKKKEKG